MLRFQRRHSDSIVRHMPIGNNQSGRRNKTAGTTPSGRPCIFVVGSLINNSTSQVTSQHITSITTTKSRKGRQLVTISNTTRRVMREIDERKNKNKTTYRPIPRHPIRLLRQRPPPRSYHQCGRPGLLSPSLLIAVLRLWST